MSKDSVVAITNSTNRDIKVNNRVTKEIFTLAPGESWAVVGNRGSEDDLIIGIMDPALSGGSTVGRFRFENPDFGYSWMKSDWSQYEGQYAMRGYGKLSSSYHGFDYVVQSSQHQKIATGRLPQHQKYIFGKFDPSYNPAASHPSTGVWAIKAADFDEKRYLSSKAFTITAEHETHGDMLWKLNVVNLDWYQNPVI